MGSEHLIGRYESEQLKAAKILLDQGPMTYDDLKDELDVEDRSVMQAVIRGLADNGLARSYVNGDGKRKYDVLNEDKVRHLT